MLPPFGELLDLIADRSTVLRSAVAVADDLGARVPGCPEWTLRDLVVHVGEVQRSWAAVVRAGDPDAPPTDDRAAQSVITGDLLEWSAESTQVLTDALRDVGPDADCWTWWELSDAPRNGGAVARHQVQEAAVHAYDAQSANGDSQELPSGIAIDSVEEFLVVSLGAMGAWPHPHTRIEFAATDGPRWMVNLTSGGAKLESSAADRPAATVVGSASNLILALYSRIPPEQLDIEGDRAAIGQLLDWARMSTE